MIIEALRERGAVLAVYDPEAIESTTREIGAAVEYGQSPYDGVENAHALLVVTDWNEFRLPNFERVQSVMADKPAVFGPVYRFAFFWVRLKTNEVNLIVILLPDTFGPAAGPNV